MQWPELSKIEGISLRKIRIRFFVDEVGIEDASETHGSIELDNQITDPFQSNIILKMIQLTNVSAMF